MEKGCFGLEQLVNVIALKFWTNCHPLPLGFETVKSGCYRDSYGEWLTPGRLGPSIIGVMPCMASGFNGYWGNLGRGLVLYIWVFIGSALFILPMSVLEVAHRFLGTSIKLGDFCWNSPSISRPKHNKSSPGLSGNSKVRSPLEAKPISLFDL